MSWSVGTASTASVSTTGPTSLTIDAPSGIVEGNLLLMAIVLNDTSPTTDPGAPSSTGWTVLTAQAQENDNFDSSYLRVSLLYKIASGSEPSTYTISWTDTNVYAQASVVAASGNAASSPSDQVASSKNGDLSTPELTDTNANDLLIVLYGDSGGGATYTVPSGITAISNNNQGDFNRAELMWGYATLSSTSVPSYTFSAQYNEEGFSIAATFLPAGGSTYTLACGEGSFTFTGDALTANSARNMSLAEGDFNFTGEPLTTAASRSLALGEGTFTFDGEALTENVGRQMALSEGSFSFTGKPMTFAVALSLLAQAGSFAFTGGAAFMSYVPFGTTVINYSKKFFATVGGLMGISGDPPS